MIDSNKLSFRGNSGVKTCIFVLMSAVNFLFPMLLFFGIFTLISKHSFFKNTPFSKCSLQLAFFLRMSSSLTVFYLYSEYYTVRAEADTFKYFDDSYYMSKAFWEHPVDFLQMLLGLDCNTAYFHNNYFNDMSNWVRSYDNGLLNDNRLVIRFNALIRIFSFGNYHVHALIFNLMAFVGSVSLGKVFYAVSKSKLKSYFSVFLIPSVIFWSSGIFKESILLFALGLFLFHFYQVSKGKGSIKSSLILLFTLGILIVMKLYVFLAFLPACVCYFISRKHENPLRVYLSGYCIFILLAMSLAAFAPQYSFIYLIVDKQRDFINLSQFFEVNSAFAMDYLEPTLWSLIKASPEAILNVFTKPWLGEVNSLLFIPPLCENVLLFVLLVLCFSWRKKISLDQAKFILFCFAFTFLVYLIIGLTTPITGALVRYKIPAVPFIWFSFLMILNTHKFPKGLRKNKLYLWLHSYL